MREVWKEVTLGDCINLLNGFAFKSKFFTENVEDIVLIKGSNLGKGCVLWNNSLFWKKEDEFKFSKYLLKENDVLLAMDRPWLNGGIKYASIKKNDPKSFLVQRIACLRSNKKMDQKFLKYVIANFDFSEYVKSIQGGVGVPHISPTQIKNYKFNLPPLTIQIKIANILSGYDDLIENNLKRIKILEEMAQQTYEEWFVRMRFPGYETATFDETGLPDGWEKKLASEVFKISIGKTPPRNEEIWFNSEKIENQIKWMSISDIRKSNIYIYNTKETLTKEAIQKFNFNIIKKGNVALSFKLTVGLVTIASEDMTTNEAIAHFNNGKVPTSYAYYYLKNFDYNSLGSTSSIGTAINSKIVKVIPFKLPTINLLNQFDEVVKPILSIIDNLNKQTLALREVRDILLPRLIMGMIDVSTSSVQGGESLEIKPNDAKIIPLEQSKKEAPKEFKEAVLIACLTDRFGSEKYPLGRKRYTKLSYLFHRYSDNKIQDYLRKAAGPYNPKTKYGGPEKIALNNKYIQNWKSDNKLTGFVSAEKIEDAKTYFANYWQIADLDWLTTEFKFKSNDELELLATVDNSLVELSKKNLEFTSSNVMNIIKSEKEWEAKLERTIFSDANVERAIGFLRGVLEYNN